MTRDRLTLFEALTRLTPDDHRVALSISRTGVTGVGRRGSFLGAVLRDMERASKRAASDARRAHQREQAARSRAFERECVREERAAERARVRHEREQERLRLSRARENEARSKREEKAAAKEAQLRAWQLEYEEWLDRELSIETIANDSPEVEDRDRLYDDLSMRLAFEPTDFTPPAPIVSSDEAHALRSHAAAELQRLLGEFRPDVLTLGRVKAAGFTLMALGAVVAFALTGSVGTLLVVTGGVVALVTHNMIASRTRRERDAHEQQTKTRVEATLTERLQLLAQHDAQRTAQAHVIALAQHEADQREAQASFEAAEDARLEAVARIRGGDVAQIALTAAQLLDLDLPVPCPASCTVTSSTDCVVEIDVPDPDVLPQEEAKLQASGKVSYKTKPEKKLREQYLKLVAGLSMRHAAEIMLHLPTVETVTLHAMIRDINPSTGTLERRRALVARYDYATLAPMTMDGIDPVAALDHFDHELSLTRRRELRRAEA